MSGTGPIRSDRPEFVAELDYDVLRGLVFDVFHGATLIGPPPDPRRGIRPFEQLCELFRRANQVGRDRITEIVREFLGELEDTTRWPSDARWDLFDFIQDCGHGLIDDISIIVRERRLYEAADIGAEGHAGLLKCLLSLGVLSTPEWWLDQLELLGEDYGALVFSGLVEHGLDEAVGQLPVLCANDHAAQEIRLLIPSMVDRFGLERVREGFASQLSRLPEDAAQPIAEDLQIAVLPEETRSTGVHWAHLIADEVILAGDSIQISDRERFDTAIVAVLQAFRIAQEFESPSEKARDELAFRQIAGLTFLLARVVSGDGSAVFLWRICEKLLLIFAGRRLATDHESLDMFTEFVREGIPDDLEHALRRASRPVPNDLPPRPSSRRGRTRRHG